MSEVGVTSKTEDPAQSSTQLRLVLFAGLATFVALLAWNLHACAGGSDSSGYLNQARLLRAGIVHPELPASPNLARDGLSGFAFIPFGFVLTGTGATSATYPIGLPLMLAAVSKIAGWNAGPPLTIALHAIAGLLLMYALARQLELSPGWSAFGALLLGTSPLYFFSSFALMSDVPALVWTTAAVLFAWRSRTRPGWALAAGGAVAVAVLIRPTNLLVLAPVAVALGGDAPRWLRLVLAGTPGAVILGFYNQAAYGHPFATGYTILEGNFSAATVPLTLQHYARWLPILLTPAILFGLGLPWLGWNRRTVLLTVWIAAFGGFYATYSFTRETWWFLRFLLPAFPPMIIAALLVAQKIWSKDSWSRWSRRAPVLLGSALVAVELTWALGWAAHLHSFKSGRNDLYYKEAVVWAKDHLPANTLLVSAHLSGSIYYYSDFTLVRWDHLQPHQIPALERTARREQRPVIAALFEFEEQTALHDRLPGRWEKIGATPRVTFWRRVIPGEMKLSEVRK